MLAAVVAAAAAKLVRRRIQRQQQQHLPLKQLHQVHQAVLLAASMWMCQQLWRLRGPCHELVLQL
jgi:hypothetical protein